MDDLMDTKSKYRRIEMLKALQNMINIEISGLRLEQQQADTRLKTLEEKLSEVDEVIQKTEDRVRVVLDSGNTFSIEEYQMLVAFIDQKQKLRINNERQVNFTQKRVEKINQSMIQQGLQIRGIENLLHRRRDELRLESDKKLLSQLDEAWLLNKKEGA
jgi:flagellar biosynthesis chaperone FliJ